VILFQDNNIFHDTI